MSQIFHMIIRPVDEACELHHEWHHFKDGFIRSQSLQSLAEYRVKRNWRLFPNYCQFFYIA